MEHFDIIIAGGGAAGLSLAYHLMLSPLRNMRILIIDKDDDDQLNRNWGYWLCEPTLYEAVSHHTWQQLDFASYTYQQRFRLGKYQYHLMHGRDFYRYVLGQLAGCTNIKFLKSVIRDSGSSVDVAHVITDDGEYTGNWLFDSVIKFGEFKNGLSGGHLLKMHFKGWEIETPGLTFDTRAARLFDLRTPQNEALRFFYLMPYAENRAFIEYTVFSKAVTPQDAYVKALEEYIKSVLGIRDYRVISEENGVVPLTDNDFPRQTGQRLMTIGSKAGRIKPSTGYSFMRIQKDSAQIVESLVKYGHPFAVARNGAFYRLCDRLLLDVMQQHGDEINAIFTAMFKQNPIDRILRFLDECNNPIDNFRLIVSLPPRLFIQAFIRNIVLRQL